VTIKEPAMGSLETLGLGLGLAYCVGLVSRDQNI